jgi:RHS repeat-associated protein
VSVEYILPGSPSIDLDNDANNDGAIQEDDDPIEAASGGMSIATHRDGVGMPYVEMPLKLDESFEGNSTAEVRFVLSDTENFSIWDGNSDAAPNQIQPNTAYTKSALFGGSSAADTLYVRADKTGEYTVTVQWYSPSEASWETGDTVVFTAKDDDTTPCGPCGQETSVDYTGYANVKEADISGGGQRESTDGSPMTFGESVKLLKLGNAVGIVSQGALTLFDYVKQVSGYVLEARRGESTQGTMSDQGDTYVFSTPSGVQQTYTAAGNVGHLLKTEIPGGAKTENTFAANGLISQKVTTLGNGGTQTATYTHANDRVTSIITTVSDGTNTDTVQTAQYEYFASGDANGPEGFLKSVTIRDGGATGDITETKLYRYYKDGDANGYEGAIKYIISDASRARMVEAGINPLTATDAQIAPYADDYFEYNDQQQVVKRSTLGGCSLGCGNSSVTYEYATSTFSDAIDRWKYKKTETQPDGSKVTTYNNYRGEELLRDVADGTDHWITYSEYDSAGNLVLSAQASAVSSYDDTQADLGVSLKASDGLIHVYDYYTTTTAPEYPASGHASSGGGVEDYMRRMGVKNGSTGTSVWQSEITYVKKTVGGVTRYFTFESTRYADEAATDAETTTYQYTFFGDTDVPTVATQTVVLPVISVAEHGSGVANSSSTAFDKVGRTIFTKDAAGYLSYMEYDTATGAVVKQIADLNTSQTSDYDATYLPSGWATPADGGEHLTSTFEVDERGRTVKSTDPAGTVTYTVYLDVDREVRTYQGWNATTSQPLAPITVYRADLEGNYSESLTFSYTDPAGLSVDGSGVPTGAESLTSSYTVIHSLSRTLLNDAGQATISRQYFSLDDGSGGTLTYSAARDFGTQGVNYLQSESTYDPRGRLAATKDATGTVHHTFYDALSRTVATWTGTDDVPTTDHMADGIYDLRDFRYWLMQNPTATEGPAGTNVYKVSETIYDAGFAGGDSLVTESRTWFDSGANDYYASEANYDWRNRVIDSRGADGVVTHYERDNLGRTEEVSTYGDSDIDYFTYDTNGNITGTNVESGELRTKSETLLDDLGRVYQSEIYKVDPINGTVGDSLSSYTWYDQRGMVVKSANANGLFQKVEFDSLGRTAVSYVSFDSDESTYAEALTVAGDTVVEQGRTYFDETGRAVASANFERLPDDTTTVGELDATNSYATASVVWHDDLGRTTHSATFGREDTASGLTHYFIDGTTGAIIDTNADGIPDEAQGNAHEPNTSDDYLVSKTIYDPSISATGRIMRSIDNAGRITETQTDLLGRTIKTIENFDDGVVDETDTDQDITVEYEYDSSGRMVTLIAHNSLGDDGDPGNENVQQQKTKYLYESVYGGSLQTAAVYPDSTDLIAQDSNNVWTISSGTDHTSTTYDRLGRSITATDQRGVVHAYSFDTAGRLISDAVTSLPSSVDDSILRIERTYDDMGRVETITSYDATSSGNVVNQVEYAYNGWGMVDIVWQEHDGVVDANTPKIQYVCDDGAVAGEAKFVRLSSIVYPDGRDVYYIYPASGVGDALDRVEAIAEDPSGMTRFAEYEYLGEGTIVSVTHPEVTGGLTLDYSPNGNFEGFDRLGRVIDQRWTNGAGTTVLDRYTYEYDRASNRTSRNNELNSAFDEDYTYDGQNRLIDTDRNGVDHQSWNLDGLGNWNAFTDQGTTEIREHNEANEITDIDGGINPTHDTAGNMTSGPKPDSPTERQHYTIDAWNRVVKVSADDGNGNPGATTAEFEYDGRNYRIGKTVSGVLEAIYYNDDHQVLEIRADGDTDPSEQYIWDLRYIDAPIVRFHDANTDGDYLDSGDSILYYANDANMNVTALVAAATGGVVERYHYDPYGTPLIYNSDWTTARTQSLYFNPYLFTGRRLDLETALYYYRTRYFDSQLARFTGRDPIVYAGDGPNLYEYVASAPLGATDPSGLKKWVDKSFSADAVGANLWSVNISKSWGLIGIAGSAGMDILYHCDTQELGLFFYLGIGFSFGFGTPVGFTMNNGVFWVYNLPNIFGYTKHFVNVTGTATFGFGVYGEIFADPVGYWKWVRGGPPPVWGFGFGVSSGLPTLSATASYQYFWLLNRRIDPTLRPRLCQKCPPGLQGLIAPTIRPTTAQRKQYTKGAIVVASMADLQPLLSKGRTVAEQIGFRQLVLRQLPRGRISGKAGLRESTLLALLRRGYPNGLTGGTWNTDGPGFTYPVD